MIAFRKIGLIVAIVLVRQAVGQTDVHGLEKAIYGKQMELRSYSADSLARYTWLNGKLVTGPVELHALETFLPDTVKLKDGKIVLKGDRGTLVRDSKKLVAAVGKAPMTIEVDLKGGDPAVIIPQLQAAIFFPDLKSAVDALPDPVADLLPSVGNGAPQSVCKCNQIFQNGAWIKVEHQSPKLTSPKIISTVNPIYTHEAQAAKVSGVVWLSVYVSESGGIGDVWLARPLDFGLDESAVKAIRQYVFKPAQYDGQSVGIQMTLAIRFDVL